MSIPENAAPESVEEVAVALTGLTRAAGEERDATTLIPNRIHIARNSDDRLELFIEGDLKSFSTSALGHGLEFGTYREIQNSREFSSVVVRAPAGMHAVRPMAHIVYEAIARLRREPGLTNEALLAALSPFLRLIVATELLSTEHQVGLVGELIFLQELLEAANALGVASRTVLDRWSGWDSASRDFAGGGVAVEVKATGGPARHHWVHPIYQLLPREESGERVYVYSVGLRLDRSRSYKLTTAIQRIADVLPDDSRDTFFGRLGKYGGHGYDPAQRGRYELEPGFLATNPPALFRVDTLPDIVRPQSFVANKPPDRAIDLRYLLSLEGLRQESQLQREDILRSMIEGGEAG